MSEVNDMDEDEQIELVEYYANNGMFDSAWLVMECITNDSVRWEYQDWLNSLRE